MSRFQTCKQIRAVHGVATILQSSSQVYLSVLHILFGLICVSSVPRATVRTLKS